MKLNIKTFEYVEKEISNFEIEIPDNELYCFQTGIRRSVRIIPNKNKEGVVTSLKVTSIYSSFECKVEQFTILTSQIERHYNSKESSPENSIVSMLVNVYYDIRTKEQFEEDLEYILNKIKNG
jgi:hypothetical protein